MTKDQLIEKLRSPMFADRPNIDDAYEYAHFMAQSTDCPAAVMTALQVVVNTICNELEKIEAREGTEA